MRTLRRFFARLANFVTRRHDDERLREEIEEHIALQTEENIRGGLSPAEARQQARLKFGGVEAVKEEYRAQRGLLFVETFLHDVRYAMRMLRKSPGFTAVAVVTLAVAIGANAVVFGVMNALILRPLNVPDPESLYQVERPASGTAFESYPDYLDLRDRNRSFDGLAAFSMASVALDTGDNPAHAWVYDVTGNYFDVLAIQPYLGRFFRASDEHGANSAPYIVLSYSYWHNHFQDDRAAVGRTVQLNKQSFTILGVAPPDFHGSLLFMSPDFFVPIVNQEQLDGVNFLNARGNRWIFTGAMGHLKPGVTPQQAVADLNSIGSYLEKTYPKDDTKMVFKLARPSLYGDVVGPGARAFLAGLMLLAGLILLAACANLGGLFAARAADRSREVALRLVLGAGRVRILRQLFTEALLISFLGGALGLWASVNLLSWLNAWQPMPAFPIILAVNPDANVYLVALLLTLASAFLFGAVPVRQVLRTDPYQIVKSGSLATMGSRITVRDLLLGAQIAICAVLVTSSLVAVRGLLRSLHGNFGFQPQNVLLMHTSLDMAGYRGDAVPVMQKRMLETMQTIPGVGAAGLAVFAPLIDRTDYSPVFTDNASDLRPSNATAHALLYIVSPDYFRAAGTTLLSGRDFTWNDDKNAPRVAVVNAEFARIVFGSATNAIGRYYKGQGGTRTQVVGVTEQGKYGNLTEDPETVMFLPILQSPLNQFSQTVLVVRSKRNPQQLAAAMRNKVRDLDSGLPVDIETWYQGMQFVLFAPRMATISLGVLGVMGALLSVTGIFGLAAYSVSKRKRELGIRIALGARRKEVLQAALGRPFKLLVVGSAAGLVLGILASRVLAYIVYQATPRDPLVLAGVALAMAFVGLLATWIPAQHALSIDPLILMREE
jgi:predicted permease